MKIQVLILGGRAEEPHHWKAAQFSQRGCVTWEEGWGGELTCPISFSAAGEAGGCLPPPKRARGGGHQQGSHAGPLSRALPGRGGH